MIARVGHLAEHDGRAAGGSDDRRPDPMALLREVSTDDRRRSALRVYLGYAPGSGTTTVMGHRRRGRWRPWDTTAEVIRLLQGVDIHVLRREHATAGR